MADTRLSDLSAAGALSASDLFYVVQTPGSGGEKATGTQLLTLVGTTYLAKAGGTMTGALTLPAGAVGTPSLMFTGAGATTGIYSAGSNDISFAVNGSRRGYFNVSTMWVDGALGLLSDTGILRFGSSSASDPTFFRAGVGSIYLRPASTTTVCTFYVSTLYTDANNYERLTLTGVAGTSVNITAETLGTGADNIDIVLTPAGTGSVKFPSGASLNSVGVATVEAVITGSSLTGNGGTFNYYLAGMRNSSIGEVAWTSGAANAAKDLAFHRNAAGVVEVNNGTAGTYRDLKLRNLVQTEYSQMTEMTAPSAPAANSVRIYAEDNGAGKTRLMALFATGAAQQIAIEP